MLFHLFFLYPRSFEPPLQYSVGAEGSTFHRLLGEHRPFFLCTSLASACAIRHPRHTELGILRVQEASSLMGSALEYQTQKFSTQLLMQRGICNPASEISVSAKQGAADGLLQDVPRTTLLYKGRKMIALPVVVVTMRKRENPPPPSPRPNNPIDPPPCCL